ncbi:MAG: right-handed parallel beta-helix repeat-containing protein [Planctomycetota bacterium]
MSRLTMVLTASACCLLSGASSGQTIVYVDADAPGPIHDGSSWEYAYRNPQDALAVAPAGAEIRVAQGVYMADGAYTPVGGAHVLGSGDLTATFQLISDVELYGGYAGHGQADPDQRDIETYETILGGDLDGNDEPASGGGASNCCATSNRAGCSDATCEAAVCAYNSGCCSYLWLSHCRALASVVCCELCAENVRTCENSIHVVTGSGVADTAILDGFTITAGNASAGPPHDCGGGMYIDTGSPTVVGCTFTENSAVAGAGVCAYSGDPTLSDCTFSGNSAFRGGGMYNDTGSPTLTDCTFGENSARYGAGMYNRSSSIPTVTNCTFSGNSAFKGGGMYNYASGPTVNNCTFSANTASYTGGGMHNSHSSPTITGCTFSENTAEWDGGGVYNWSSSSPTVIDCAFNGNTAVWSGGGVYNIWYSDPTLIDCMFTANSADAGGGMYDEQYSAPFIHRCTFVDNHARVGAGLYSGGQACPTAVLCNFFNNNSLSVGGGVFSERLGECSATFVGCMFCGNRAGSGGGIYARYVRSLQFTNCIFSTNSAHTGGGISLLYSSATVTNCTFAGNAAPEGRAVACQRSSPAIANSILWDGGDEIWLYFGSAVAVTYSDVQGGWPGDGNIDADPLFVDPDGPDDFPGTEDDDLRLGIGSPCTDAGDNTAVPQDVSDLDDDGDVSERTPLDLDGNARFIDDPCIGDSGVSDPPDYVAIVDIGAFELAPDRNENGIPDESEPDSDGDGTPDLCESCPFDPDKVEPGICGCGIPDVGDDDADGVLDCVDQCPNADDAVFAPGCVDAIPTVSAWGLVVLVLLLLVGHKIHFRRRTA